MSKIKTINALMKHMRAKHGIEVNGSSHKRKLRNLGYYHGYKGYRFIKNNGNSIKFSNFDEIEALNKFDMELKTLFYPKIMYLETALKNYVLEIVLNECNTESFNTIYESLLTGYKDTKNEKDMKSEFQKRLRLRDSIYNELTKSYSRDTQVVKHFYQKDKPVPIWSIFEVITLGQFGTFISCLNTEIKHTISKELNLNKTCDQNGKLTENIVYLLKDLRNSVAHNNVIFDCRFKNSNISKALINCIEHDTSISNINFRTILDYVILVVYMLKKLDCSKTDLNIIIRDYDKSIEDLREKIPVSYYNKIVYTDTKNKLEQLKKYIKS